MNKKLWVFLVILALACIGVVVYLQRNTFDNGYEAGYKVGYLKGTAKYCISIDVLENGKFEARVGDCESNSCVIDGGIISIRDTLITFDIQKLPLRYEGVTIGNWHIYNIIDWD